jgi:hypothetical protein
MLRHCNSGTAGRLHPGPEEPSGSLHLHLPICRLDAHAMPAPDDLLPDALVALSRAFGAPAEAAGVALARLTLADVRCFLEAHILRLLDHNPGMLLHILYRVDVAEEQVKAAFRQASPAELPGQLADLLIARQLQKLEIRRRYRSSGL